MDDIKMGIPSKLMEANLDIEAYPADAVPETLLEQLIVKSRQPHIMRFEGQEDAHGRFKDIEAYSQWAAGKERVLYLLLNKGLNAPGQQIVDVGGVIWFSEKTHPLAPGYDITFSIRLYDEDQTRGWGKYVGRKLSLPFMQAAHDRLRERYPNQWVWLDLVESNEAAHRAYQKFGYVELARSEGRVIMGHTAALATGTDG